MVEVTRVTSALRVESSDEYPDALWDGLTELGVFGLGIPEELGGAGGGMFEIALACEVFGYYGGSAVMTYMPTGVFGSQTLVGGASDDMKERFLPEIANGTIKTAFGLTEPDAGSDAAALRTRAVRDGDEWVINGSKIWTSGATAADFIVCSARTGAQAERSNAITVFVVPTSAQGLQITPISKLGHHAVPSCEVGLTDVRVPHENIIGEVGGGWRALLRTLDAERIAVAAICTGSSQRCLDMALSYGLERRQFGKPIASFQAISHMLAEMETETTAARLLAYHAAWVMDTKALLPGGEAVRGRRRHDADPAQHHRPASRHSGLNTGVGSVRGVLPVRSLVVRPGGQGPAAHPSSPAGKADTDARAHPVIRNPRRVASVAVMSA
jgi:alkylation response protein AidB-like acyl-CoA dehydrogenase